MILIKALGVSFVLGASWERLGTDCLKPQQEPCGFSLAFIQSELTLTCASHLLTPEVLPLVLSPTLGVSAF